MNPENDIIKMAASQNYESFAKQELALRRDLLYPPFGDILKITIVDKDEMRAWKLGDEIALFLREQYALGKWERTEIMGPFPLLFHSLS